MTNPNDLAFTGKEELVQHCPSLAPEKRFVPGGLTKREYFAAMALCGIAKNSIHETIEGGRSVDYEVCAMTALSMADALIAELNK
jgi:hypothetical protein